MGHPLLRKAQTVSAAPLSNSHNTQFHQTHHTHSLAHRAPSHRRSSLACSLVRSLPRGELCSQWISHLWRPLCPRTPLPTWAGNGLNTQRFLVPRTSIPEHCQVLACLPSLSSWLPMKALWFGNKTPRACVAVADPTVAPRRNLGTALHMISTPKASLLRVTHSSA